MSIRDIEVLALFELALEQPSEGRRDWLLAQTEGDDGLRRAVLDLLQSDGQAQRLLPTGGAGQAGDDAPPPERIGAWRIIDKLGVGGMGAVYKAVRDTADFHQTVAIKLIRRGAMWEALVERFVVERRILAGLTHPNIARLLDGGTLDGGLPYLVMEFVDGLPILEHCESQGLDVRARLGLFRDIVKAVAYAHQLLIIHRDLTPNNVLVTREGQVKLIDFGISRPIDRQPQQPETAPEDPPSPAPAPAAADASLEARPTVTGAGTHTPGYAAPERMRGRQASSTLVDIYSLGVLLRELCLSGRDGKPFTADLRAIIAKATQTDPAARYPSASAMLDDLDRMVDRRALSVRREEPLYTTWSFFRRHPRAIAASVAAAIGLLGASIAAQVFAYRADQARQQAEQRFTDLRSLSGFMMFDLYDAVGGLKDSTPVRARLAEEAQVYLDRLSSGERLESDLSLKLDIIDGYRRLAEVRGSPEIPNLGDREGARAAFSRARELANTLDRSAIDVLRGNAQVPTDEEARLAAALGRIAYAEATMQYFSDFKVADAISGLNSAKADFEVARRTGSPQHAYGYVTVLAKMLSLPYYHTNANDETLNLINAYEAALATLDPDDPDYSASQRLRILTLDALKTRPRAQYAWTKGERDASMVLIGQAVDALQPLVDANPLEKASLKSLVLLYDWRAGAAMELQDADRAAADYDRAVVLAEQFRDVDPADTEAVTLLRQVSGAKAFFRAAVLEDANALAEMKAQLELRRADAAAEPESMMRQVNYVQFMRPYGATLWVHGQVAESCAVLADAVGEIDRLTERSGATSPDLEFERTITLDFMSDCPERALFSPPPAPPQEEAAPTP